MQAKQQRKHEAADITAGEGQEVREDQQQLLKKVVGVMAKQQVSTAASSSRGGLNSQQPGPSE